MSTLRVTTPLTGSIASDIEEPSGIGSNGSDIGEDEGAEQLRLSKRINQSFDLYTKTLISISSTLRFPPPQPIRRVKELDDDLIKAKKAWEDELVRREETNSQYVKEVTVADYFTSTSTSNSNPHLIIPSPSRSSSPPPEGSQVQLKTVEDIALESRLSDVRWRHEEQRRIFEWHLRKNSDDFMVEKYQRISILEYTIPTAGIRPEPCFTPQLKYLDFYGENDCTLGLYIQKSIDDTLAQFLDPKAICTGNACNQPLPRHSKVYMHNETRLSVAVEIWDGSSVATVPSSDLITTWSACRICGSTTLFTPVSEDMQRYSFAKFLELYFYPADLKLAQGVGCQHDRSQHHVRFFASKGMTVQFRTDPVVLHDLVYPPMRIRVRPESQLELKNADFERLHRRNLIWYTALVDDLKLISIDAATGDEEADARLTTYTNSLISRAECEREEISRLIDKIYKESALTDTLALNQVRAQRQDKIVEWQLDFDKLPKPRPVERSTRKSSGFGPVRAMFPARPRFYRRGSGDDSSVSSASASEVDGVFSRMRRVTRESFISSSSEASERESVRGDANAAEAEFTPSGTEPLPTTEETGIPPTSNPKYDPESDSTIGVARDEAASSSQVPLSPSSAQHSEPNNERVPRRPSRLPRRSAHHPSVAELVKKYQDILPAQGMQELASSAFPPRILSESDQEYMTPILPRHVVRHKTKHHLPFRKPSTSDLESSYAANIAPRYLTRSRRSQMMQQNSRIPGPILSPTESHESSHQTIPYKRGRMDGSSRLRRLSPVPNMKGGSSASTSKDGNSKPRLSVSSKDKVSTRPNITSNKPYRRPPGPGNKVSNMSKHFECLYRDNERSKRRYSVIRGRRARPVASARAKVEVLDSVKDAIEDESESSDFSSEADDEGEGDWDDEGRQSAQLPIPEEPPREDLANVPQLTVGVPETPSSPKVEGKPELQTTVDREHATVMKPVTQASVSVPPSPFLSSSHTEPNQSTEPPPHGLDGGTGASQSTSLLKALGNWLQQSEPPRHPTFRVDDPMIDPEHIFRDSSMVVRTDEPTSIIAMALNSPQYREMLAKSRAEKQIGGEGFIPGDRSIAKSTSTWGAVNVETTESVNPTEELRTPSSRLPWAISFESGGLTISCTVLYPEQFDALRRTYGCEKSMIESLARCVKWDVRDRKASSAFLKTRDDRFIAKDISPAELQTMETFAPAYFDYLFSAVTSNRLTLLSKVFGCYKLMFKVQTPGKPGKYKSTQMNLLVMENLFYDRQFSTIYDLKGSTYGRYMQPTGSENEVLLDGNLIRTNHLDRFYLREHSKRILRGAIHNDSKFLVDINVMDYSLVVGLDNQKNELVVGIVDYMRPYTWDRKLESWVKESAFLGGVSRGAPTIVTPKQYRQRFINAMEQYFPLVPDRWMKQKDQADEDPHSLLELWPDW